MTREENIATLNEHLDHWKRLLSEKICDQDEGEKTIDALQNAIKALQQEPCKDAVSRQAVKEQMIYYGFLAPDMTVTEFVEDCLPSVNPQKTKTGVLDEIRSEIKETKNNLLFNMVSKDIILEVIINIIDKYKTESED